MAVVVKLIRLMGTHTHTRASGGRYRDRYLNTRFTTRSEKPTIPPPSLVRALG